MNVTRFLVRSQSDRIDRPSPSVVVRPFTRPGVITAAFFLMLPLVHLALTAPAMGQSKAAPGESSVGAVCDAYWSQDYDEALKLANRLLGSQQTPPPDKVEAYKCQACTYVAKRQVSPARKSIAEMLGIDPAARFSPPYTYPPPVLELYHAVQDSLHTGTMDIQTVAVGDFENNSPYTGKFKNYDFSLLGPALVHTVMADLAEATPLKIVDRQRTEQLTKEIQLGQSGFADPDQAVRAGKMLGAQTFIFGQFMVLSKDKVRIDARVVHTATGQVILTRQITGDFSGDPEKFLALERQLVVALAKGIGEILAGGGQQIDLDHMTNQYFDGKQSSIKSREDYVESKFKTAEALELEDKGDYSGAKSVWKKVLEIDPANEVAGDRLRALNMMG